MEKPRMELNQASDFELVCAHSANNPGKSNHHVSRSEQPAWGNHLVRAWEAQSHQFGREGVDA
jgi:hypothetical protein